MAARGQNPKIVLSYRRSDSAMAGRIFDRLAQHFGKANLFIDIDNVPFGVDFRKQIDDALQASDLLIAVVGEKWLGPQAGGKLRIMNQADPVRVELETALKRDITVLPVLLDGTAMPDPADLPEGIRDFAYRNAIEVESGRDFNMHIDRLIRAIEQILGLKSKPSPETPVSRLLSPGAVQTRTKRWPYALGLAVLLGVAAAAAWLGRDWISTPATHTSEAVPYCADLKRVVTAAKTNFASILGPGSPGSWPSRVQLPGWYECRIIDYTFEGKTKRYFYCDQPPFVTLDAAHTKRDAIDADLGPCLGADWARRQAVFSDNTTDTIYYMGNEDPEVRIRESYVKDHQQWNVSLQVQPPGSLANQPPQSDVTY